jgi:quercetin dioxygenase-like cupin family protein
VSWFVVGIVTGVVGVSLAQAPSQDPVALSPQYYTVRVDNDTVRVLEYRLPPGKKEVMHTHPPGVVFSLGDSQFRTTLPDGKSSDATVHNGDVTWRERTVHAAENIGSTEAHMLAIELKKCN